MALTPEQIKASLASLTPSDVKKAVPKKVKPLIEPSTTTTTTEIMPQVASVQPLSPKQNIMSPSLEVQSGIQPEKDYKALATPEEKSKVIRMLQAGIPEATVRAGFRQAIDRRLTQENNARGQEPKKYVMTPEMFQAEQNKGLKDIAGGLISSATSVGESVTSLLDKPAQALARAIAPSQGVSQEQVTSNIQSVQERENTPIGARITGGDPESIGYKGGKLAGDIAQTAMVGGLASKIPAVAGTVSKLGALGNAGKIAVGALEGAGGQAVYSGIADKRLPTAGELALGAGVGGAIPALGIAYKGAKKVLPKIADKADDAANKMLTNMNRITKGEQEKFAVQQGKTVGEWMNSKGLVSGGDESIEALAKGFKASKDKADEGLSLIKGEYKNDYLSTMAREASEFADNTLSPQASKMKELADKADNIGLTMPETNEVKRFFERNNKFTYGRDITAGEKTVRATNLDNYVRNRQLDIAEQNGFGNLKEINKDTQGYKYLLDKLIKNENGRLGNNAVTLTDWIVAGEVAANPQAIALLVGKKVASSNWFRKGVVKILNKIGNAKSEADRLVDIAKIQRIQNEKDLTKFLSLPYKKDANIPTYSLNSSNSVKGVVRPITPSGVIQETSPVLPKVTIIPKKTIVEKGRATHDPYKTVTMDTKVVAPKKTVVPKTTPVKQEVAQSTTAPKTVNVWIKSKFSNEGAYKDIPVIEKVDNITLYQGGSDGKRQFWTKDKKYAEQFGKVQEKTGSFYKVDNGNRVTDVYVEATAPKKQSVLPKPQEKQAVLDGKKEELLFRYANKENINSDMYRGGTWYGEKDLISHYKNKDKNIALGGKELFQAPKKIEKPYSVNTDDYEVGKDILMMTKFGKSGSKLGYGERPNFVKDILDENTYNKVLDIVFEKEDDILLKQLKSLLPKEKYDLISKQPFYNQKTMTVDYLLSQKLKKMGYDGIELLENGKKREVMIFDKKSPVPTPKAPVSTTPEVSYTKSPEGKRLADGKPIKEDSNTYRMLDRAEQRKLDAKKAKESPVSKDLQPLYEEARKYKSADEFVGSKGKPLYHGTDKKFENFKKPVEGEYGSEANFFSPTEQGADYYRRTDKGEVKKIYLDNDVKVWDREKETNQNDLIKYIEGLNDDDLNRGKEATVKGVKRGTHYIIQDPIIIKYIKNKGFDGFTNLDHTPNGIEETIGIFSPDKIKTEAQLRKIREEAQRQ